MSAFQTRRLIRNIPWLLYLLIWSKLFLGYDANNLVPQQPGPTPHLFLSFKASRVQPTEISAQRSVCTCLYPLERVRPWLDAKSERPGGWESSAWSKRPGYSLTRPQEELSVRRPTSPRAHTVYGVLRIRENPNHGRWVHARELCSTT